MSTRAAWNAWRMGNVSSVLEMSVKAMEARRKLLRQEDERMLISMVRVDSVYNMAGRWDEAEELLV